MLAAWSVSCSGNNNGTAPGNARPGSGGWGGQQGQATSVEVAEVTQGSISELVRSYGTIRARDVVAIIPQVSNRVVRIEADLGDEVRRGQVLARIYDVPFQESLQQAEAQLRQSRSAFVRDSSSYARQRLLHERGASSDSELENARTTFQSSQAQYESAQASVAQSREDLSNTVIRSPVDGVVLNRNIAEGDLARSGEPAFEVANMIGFETRLFLPMQDWERIEIGMPVEMSLSNRDPVVATGVVSRVSPQLNPTTGLGEIVVSLTEAGSSVRQGVLVESRITLQTRDNSVVIPRSAMIEQVDTFIEPETNTVEIRRTYNVFVAQGDTVVQRRRLELGLEQGERVEVLDGLQAGERMVVTGQRNLNDQSRIRIAGQSRTRPDTLADGEGTPAREGNQPGQGQRRPGGGSR